MQIRTGKGSILGDENGVTITLRDELSGVCVAKIKMSPQEFLAAAMGRLSRVHCQYEHGDLSRVGKKMVADHHHFKLDKKTLDLCQFRSDAAWEIANRTAPEGWVPDNYFGSHNSFYTKDGEQWAQCVIRKWVEVDQTTDPKETDDDCRQQ